MKDFLHAYSSSLFIFEKTNQNKFITLADTNNVVHEVYDDDKIIIRDVKDMSKKDFYRQLVLKSSPNEVESEIRIYSISEKDSKSSTFKTIKTNKFFKNKKEKSCVDTYSLINHFVKIACSSMHFMDLKDWETKPKEILIIGGSVGTLPFFLKTIYKQYVNITVLEKNPAMKQIGEEYFGFKDMSYNWETPTNYLPYIQSTYDKRTSNKAKIYDLIIINENNYGVNESISPNQDLISKKTLELYKVSVFNNIINRE